MPGLLDTYEEERLPVARALLNKTNALGASLLSTGAVAGLLRDRVIVPLLSYPRIRSELLLRLAQLDIAYRDLLRFRRGPRPGDRAPDAPRA